MSIASVFSGIINEVINMTKPPNVTSLRKIPEAPAHLSEAQKDTWQVVMESSAGRFVEPGVYPLVIEYARAVEVSNQIAEIVNIFDQDSASTNEGLRRWNKLSQMQCRAAGRVADLATKLRLTPSTRVHPRTAGAAERNHSKHKPWQC